MNVTGIDNHELNELRIVDASATATTQYGDVIIILRQYTLFGRDRTIHSCAQLEYYKIKVNDRSMQVGGFQHISTADGYILPLDIVNSMVYLHMRPNTDDEWKDLPHVLLTHGNTWDPRVIDIVLSDKEDWVNTPHDFTTGKIKPPFDSRSNYKKKEPDRPITILPGITNNEQDMSVAL